MDKSYIVKQPFIHNHVSMKVGDGVVLSAKQAKYLKVSGHVELAPYQLPEAAPAAVPPEGAPGDSSAAAGTEGEGEDTEGKKTRKKK